MSNKSGLSLGVPDRQNIGWNAVFDFFPNYNQWFKPSPKFQKESAQVLRSCFDRL
jgi:hypothetical protein